MRSFGTIVLAFFVSTIVAGIVQNQLAVAFGAREEFIVVMVLFVLVVITVTVAFGLALAFARTVAGIDWTALALAGLVVLLIAGLLAAAAIADRRLAIGRQDLAIIAELAVPAAVLIAIQWWLVRRRRARDPD